MTVIIDPKSAAALSTPLEPETSSIE